MKKTLKKKVVILFVREVSNFLQTEVQGFSWRMGEVLLTGERCSFLGTCEIFFTWSGGFFSRVGDFY